MTARTTFATDQAPTDVFALLTRNAGATVRELVLAVAGGVLVGTELVAVTVTVAVAIAAREQLTLATLAVAVLVAGLRRVQLVGAVVVDVAPFVAGAIAVAGAVDALIDLQPGATQVGEAFTVALAGGTPVLLVVTLPITEIEGRLPVVAVLIVRTGGVRSASTTLITGVIE